MSLFKKTLTVIVLMSLGFSTQTHSFEIKEETRIVANRVMQNIFSDIDAQKGKYKDLRLFSRLALKTNPHGIHKIEYYFKDPLKPKSRYYLELFVSILPMDEVTAYDGKEGFLRRDFPVLGLKIVAFQNPTKKRQQVDIFPSVLKRIHHFHDHQSAFLPLQFSLIPKKDSFQRGEPIEFTAVVRNQSIDNVLAKEPSMRCIAFQFDDVAWGADPQVGARGAKTRRLRSQDSLSKAFTMEGFQEVRELEIHAQYLVPTKNVLPTASFKVSITP